MTFNPRIWHPIAIVLSGVNLVAGGVAAGAAEPMHAAVHGVVALASGLWAWRLRRAPEGGERQARLEELEAEMTQLGRELTEAQERLDFAERMLAQRTESRPPGPVR